MGEALLLAAVKDEGDAPRNGQLGGHHGRGVLVDGEHVGVHLPRCDLIAHVGVRLEEGKQVVARDMARPLREDRAVVQSVQDAEWEEQKLKRAKEMRELRELKNNPLLATSVDKRVSAQTEIEEKRLARHAEVDSLTKQTELTAWQEQIKMNQDVQRRAKVVERVSLEEEEAVKPSEEPRKN